MPWPRYQGARDDLLFSGLKVIDAGSWVAGPAAATILADYGADVIKVEQPDVGDGYRRLQAAPGQPQSAVPYMWMADARNKRGITLNLGSPEGKAILLDLVRDCDVFLTNQPLGQRRRFGLMYEDIAPLNERMIYASVTAYGEVGEESDLEGFDANAYWARSGLMEDVHATGASMAWSAPGLGDHPTATALYGAIVTALYQRERTGRGTKVHTSLLASGIWANLCLVQGAVVGADFGARKAYRSSFATTGYPYKTSDGRFLQLLLLRTDDALVQLIVLLGLEPLLSDPRFSTAESRASNKDGLIEALQERFLTRSADEWIGLCRASGLPVMPIAKTEDVPRDSQARMIGAFIAHADADVPAGVIATHPINVDGAGRAPLVRAPDIGEHTRSVLRAMGLDEATLDDYEARGIT